MFLTELSHMIDATYLVGTFNSNVNALVGILRACPGTNRDATRHYAQTYGVDGDSWYLR